MFIAVSNRSCETGKQILLVRLAMVDNVLVGQSLQVNVLFLFFLQLLLELKLDRSFRETVA